MKRPPENTTASVETASKRPKPNGGGDEETIIAIPNPDKADRVEEERVDPAQPVVHSEAGIGAGGEAAEATNGKEGKGKPSTDKRRQKGGGKKGKEKDYVRSRRRGTRPEGEEAPAPTEGESKAPRLPKRPVALLIGFCVSSM